MRLGRAENVPALETPFDKILAVNALQFWGPAGEPLRELRWGLRSGGPIAIAFQPRGPGGKRPRGDDAGRHGATRRRLLAGAA